jgi:cytochrome c peroxidase
MRAEALVASLVALLLGACAPRPTTSSTPWTWSLPPGFPMPVVPDDDPLTVEKVALGRRLFFDPQLSVNQTTACATCHDPAHAYTDGKVTAVGSTGQPHRRNTQTLVNVAWASSLTWANGQQTVLAHQALVPLLGHTPVELGWQGRQTELFARLSHDADYARRFEAVFGAEGLSLDTITRALAAFERTLVSGTSPWDRFVAGDLSAVSDAAKRGHELFASDAVGCSQCHAGFAFTDAVVAVGAPAVQAFHNTGLYDVDGRGAYPASDQGELEITNHAVDMGCFKAPTLRNLRFTGPYLHDGSAATLAELVDAYSAGGRARLQTGHASLLQSPLVRPLGLDEGQKADLLAFLEALDDDDFVSAQTAP